MITNHQEIEIKLEATDVAIERFKKFCMDSNSTQYLWVKGPDHFYTQNDNTVRVRVKEMGNIELTVKKRKSKVSTQDREEIDLPLQPDTNMETVEAWLKLAGFAYNFSLFKEAHIFTVNKSGHKFTVVLYDVCRLVNGVPEVNTKRFIEVEVDKDATISVDNAKRLLREWKTDIKSTLNVDGEPINASLFEMYDSEINPKGDKAE